MVSLKIEVRKKDVTWVVLLVAVLVVGVVYALASGIDTSQAYHESDQISVSVSGVEKTLQDAINSGILGGDIPSGFCMFSRTQTGCPFGWSRDSSFDGKTLRGASTPGGTGGSASHTHTTGSHTLTIAEMPSHRHRTGGPIGPGDVSRAYGEINQYAEVGQTSAVGGNQPHNHGDTGSTSSWPPYRNVIVCCKN